ncbi:TonB-dependent receptor [Aurantiacibacter poecillastricola]|uniref:TonB-dependent receptor n=1 Tax=Aurantiacibacter poecillastricola TaxID=3064385 RepID=UPI00273E6EEE|nr:TonB-dependent receptor [Aurantiacibacter sp. 219JJ12-13]MDP5259978.1 TonB-dependent receptor [Aurantiacibacter sp. 219JJ12-13]
MRRSIAVGASVLSLAIASTTAAQSVTGDEETTPPPVTGESAGISDIVVTATRQATNMQDTPIAITAVTSKDLEVRGLSNVEDLTVVVPNAEFRRTHGAFGPGVSASIRGIGQSDTNIGNDPVVAYYIDDIYYPTLLGSNFDLLDIDHVEVLRGPQGTLFGRNSLAGAVNIVSRQPDFLDASSYVELTVGSFNRTDIRAGFNMPLGENLALMASGALKKRRGYQRVLDFVCEMNRLGTPELAGDLPPYDLANLGNPEFTPDDCIIGRFGGEDVAAVRAAMAWEPTERLRLTVSGDYTRDESSNPADKTLSLRPALNTPNENLSFAYYGVAYDDRFITPDPYETFETYNDPIGAGTVIPGHSYYNGSSTRGGHTLAPRSDLDQWGVSGKLQYEISSDIDLTAVVGYRSLVERHVYQKDGTPLQTEMTTNDVTNNYVTAEARLSGQHEWIDWIFGAFYFEAEGTQHAIIDQPRTGLIRTLFNTFDPISKAVYANATVRPFGYDNGLSLTGGLRYSDDKKEVSITNLLENTPAPGDIRFNVTPEATVLSWKAGINYEISPSTLVYASAATGYTLPGFNARPQQATQVAQFDGNENIAYEVGAKLDLFNRRLRMNLAGFYTDFSKRPLAIGGQEILLDASGNNTPGNQVLIPLPEGPDGSTTCRARTAQEIAQGVPGYTCIIRNFYQNTPAEIIGFEAEITAEPIDNLLFNGALGYSKFSSPDIDARTVNARQPEPFWTANAGLQYTIEGAPLGGTITPRVDWSFQGSRTFSRVSTEFNQPSYMLVNARVAYAIPDYDFEIALGVTNLFEDLYYHNFFLLQDFGQSNIQGQPAAPREWYLRLSKSF